MENSEEPRTYGLLNTSPSTAKINAALADAQGEFKPVRMSGFNPHFKKPYSTLADGIEATVDALSKNGLGVVQGGAMLAGNYVMVTRLSHESGEWIESVMPIFASNTGGAQGFGSGVSYSRRQSYFGMTCIAPEDEDDGAQANGGAIKGKDAKKVAPQEQQPTQANEERMRAEKFASGLLKTIAAHVQSEDAAGLAKIAETNRAAIGDLRTNGFADLYRSVASAIANGKEKLAPTEIDPADDGATPETPEEFAASTGVQAPEAPRRVSRPAH